MRPTLQIKLGQRLAMTPQLQQSIRLLQLSSVDLQQEILEQLYSNPLLELDESESTSSEEPLPTTANADTSADFPEGDDEAEPLWEEFVSDRPAKTTNNTFDEVDLDSVHAATESLSDHLLWQLNLANLSPDEVEIGKYLIDALDDRGFISAPLDELLPPKVAANIDLQTLESVLHQIQLFDPPGIAARSLQECLLIQLNQCAYAGKTVEIARILIEEHLEQLPKTSPTQLAKKLDCSELLVEQAIQFIRSLNPSPGESVGAPQTDYITPDVRVRKIRGKWTIQLNEPFSTRLRINEDYSELIHQGENSTENQFLKQNLQDARWFLRSLESRNETLLRVTSAIVEKQIDFLERGPIGMKPMVLNDIAELLELHESTVSRVTTKKYIDTPQGIFELKYFFSSQLSTASGDECSSTAVCAMLKAMIEKENPTKPLSDNTLMQMLQDRGINIARRTIAKYREGMGISSSSQRKRLITD